MPAAGPRATDSQDDSVAASFVLAATPNSATSGNGAEGATLASTLAGPAASIVSADVALDAADPVIGSFTVDGLTYAVNDGKATLVAVSPDLQQVMDSQDADDSRVAPMLASGQVAIPASVAYNGTTYPVAAIGPYAFYLSGVTDVALPASIASVDSRAFRSSDVAWADVDPANSSISSYDGALYSADMARILLVPEGRSGQLRISSQSEQLDPGAFSHCASVVGFSVDAGCPAFSSWEGCLYSADGSALLRVAAGATDIAIRDSCTTVAAGALEGCAKLERINAPASVTSISPDSFTSIPTFSLPVASVSSDSQQVADSQDASGSRVAPMLASGQTSDLAATQPSSQDEENPGVTSSLLDQAKESTNFAPQLTAMVALSSADDDLPEVDPSSIQVTLPVGADALPWQAAGFSPEFDAETALIPSASIQSASTFDAYIGTATFHGSGGTLYLTVQGSGSATQATDYTVGCYGNNWALMPEATAFHYYRSDGALMAIAAGYRRGYTAAGWSGTYNYHIGYGGGNLEEWVQWRPNTYAISLDAQGSSVSPSRIAATYDQDLTLPIPTERTGYKFLGWNTAVDGSGTMYQPGTVRNLTDQDGATVTLYAQWKVCEIGFDTDSEPDDADYPGVDKEPISAPDTVGPDGTIAIEDPKRPGYVFEGWVIPTEDGTEAVDQELVYQGDDGKWYVDASKLPDYTGDDGRVELTARWTSVISVDVPSSVTFYADLVTQGQESREGAAEGAFGQNKVSNQSQVDLRVVGLESSAVKTTDTTLGADSVLKKASAATPSTSTQKLLSLYPSTKQWTADDLKDPDAVGGTKAATAVDFDLDDILLERSFSADDFTIPAGDTLNMGYRLNLAETGQQLDYDKLSTLSEGQSASIANVSYTFAGDVHLPTATGSKSDPLWIEYEGRVYGLQDIKDSAECISEYGSASPCYPLYKRILDAQLMENGNPVDSSAPYFQLKVDGRYLPVQLIGIAQDTKSDGTGNAGLTFQMRDIYAYDNKKSAAAGGGTFNTAMNSANTNINGWGRPTNLRDALRSTFWGYLPTEVQDAIVGVDKFQQLPGGTDASKLQKTTGETIWLPSMYEAYGASITDYNESEALGANGNVPFQYMAYQGNAGSIANARAAKTYNGSANPWWSRSAPSSNTINFCSVGSGGIHASYSPGVAPCFCL